MHVHFLIKVFLSIHNVMNRVLENCRERGRALVPWSYMFLLYVNRLVSLMS